MLYQQEPQQACSSSHSSPSLQAVSKQDCLSFMLVQHQLMPSVQDGLHLAHHAAILQIMSEVLTKHQKQNSHQLLQRHQELKLCWVSAAANVQD